jgi:hypothetical protein
MKWNVQAKTQGMKDMFKLLIKAFPAGDWSWLDILKSLDARQRNRRCKFRAMVKRGDSMPVDCPSKSWQFFVREVQRHRTNPDWNLSQRNATSARKGNNRWGSGGIDSFQRKFVSFSLSFTMMKLNLVCVKVNQICTKLFYLWCLEGEIWYGSSI